MSSPSWSRYGSPQRRVCARAGCNAPAVATLRFQPTERQAWLAELDESAARTQGDLCQRHAAALVLPRGWELHDERRMVTPRVAPVPPETAPAGTERPEPAAAADAAVEVEVVAESPDGDPADHGQSNGNGTRSVPAQFGTNDAEQVDETLDTILDARTPLLQRAFRNARPTDQQP